jgi:hypothetical protein
VSVGATPVGRGPLPKNSDADTSNSSNVHATVDRLGWACPLPVAKVSLNSSTPVVTSVAVNVNETGMPWPCEPTICPAPLLFSPVATDTVIQPRPSQLSERICLPAGAGPDADAGAAEINPATATTKPASTSLRIEHPHR